ncbi:chloride channel protein [Nitratidesulfovibrio vulgaris]|uniref:Cl-channel, voltage-gated family protein n=1 Tax=Nitratidesulfovibrio vulgaris (strain DP4) TaxID=391774 RepID=A0A0H3AA38_NITV4|nr:chloride channel protein [Nitratidesulfovibrio vulgaris]ABM29501.1 Cl- channel, voltage-gated family protein [Nitratidesulfovibrio vulgaris DP4]GEB80641.1 chloride channel protein [Desulfovibrio desulfuricans]
MLRILATPWREFARLYSSVAFVRLAVLGIGLGVVSGCAAMLFFLGIEYAKHLILVAWAGLSLPAPAGEGLFHDAAAGGAYRPWVIPLATCATGLVTGWLVQRFLPDSLAGMTDGTDAMIRAFHRGKGVIRKRAPFIKGLTSILTIASGGSAGREGPISQIGAGLGSFVADRLHLSTKERRLLMLAGAAGGLGAVFRAPLGGALTAIEVVYREDFEAEAMLPAILSSVVAYTLFAYVFGTEPMFAIPRFSFSDMRELPFYLTLALACAFTGWAYVRTFRFMKYGVFLRLAERVGIMWTTALGGLLVGLFGIIYTPMLSDGYGWVEQAILGHLTVTTMVTIMVAKTLATAMTLGSGMSGGMFAPALFVGGMTGGVVGYAAHDLFPHIVREPGGYVLVGMAAFFAGVAHAPVGPLIMVCELTQGYGLLAPLMLASAVCILLNRKVSLYENQVENKFESPAHASDATVNLLEGLTVRECFHRGVVPTLEEGTTLKALTDVIAGTSVFTFPVRGASGMLSGILAVQDVRALLYEESLFDLVVVRDLMRPLLTLAESDDLYAALLRFVDTDLSHIIVVDDDDREKVLGLLYRADLFKAYSDALRIARED